MTQSHHPTKGEMNFLGRTLTGLTQFTVQLIELLDQKNTLKDIFLACLPVVLLLNFPTLWTGGEEYYFQIALRQVEPDRFSSFHAVFDRSSSRFLGEYGLGIFVSIFGYEVGHAIAKTAIAGILATGITYFFWSLRLSALTSLAVIAIYCFAGQTFIGGEELFDGTETKTIAYAGVFFALGAAFHRRWMLAIMATVFATYFHFLVGGAWAAAIIGLCIFQSRDPLKAGSLLLLYSLCVMPLVIIIAMEQFGQSLPPTDVNLAKLYAIRNAHHIAPFLQLQNFVGWIPGTLRAAIFLVVILLLRACRDDKLLLNLTAALLAYLFVALLVSFLDRNTFYFSKFYLFRPAGLTLFMCVAVIVQTASFTLGDNALKLVRILFSGVIAYFISISAIHAIHKTFRPPAYPEQSQLISAIEKHSASNQIVLIDEQNSVAADPVRLYQLHRVIPRPTLVSWKFVPSSPKSLVQWHERLKFQEILFSAGCTRRLDYPVKLLLFFDASKLDKLGSCGKVVFQAENVFLLEVDEKWLPQ